MPVTTISSSDPVSLGAAWSAPDGAALVGVSCAVAGVATMASTKALAELLNILLIVTICLPSL